MDPMLIAGAGLLFLAVVAIVVGFNALVAERQLMARRLSSPDAADMRPTDIPRLSLDDGFLKRFDDIATPQDAEERSRTRDRLVKAGYRQASAMRVFFISRALMGIALVVLATGAVVLLSPKLPVPILAAIIVFAGLLGFLAPSLWLDRETAKRKEEAELAFPDVLDMLLICLEAGLGMDQACRRVAKEIRFTSPVLFEELNIVNTELWAGKDRSVAFREFAERLGVNDIRAFTTVLKQSDEFGVSIADALRVYGGDMRNKRVMRAEEKANLMPVKVAMGSILFTVPPTLLIMAGPSLIMMLRAFSGAH
jgi:tight adherence protein C